ncbi:MAG TPA: ABC transporter ATP-binding protein [Ktedonobacterales bacterium]
MGQAEPGGQSSVAYDVELRHVTKSFAGATAVRDLSLRVERGAFYSLLGPSGCGKTTTLRLIAGFEQPTSGQVLIGDVDVAGLPPYRRDCHTVFQSYSLFPHMTVADNIAYGLRQKRLGRDEISRRVEDALAMVRLPGAGARRPAQLSGGQQQRVALARALVNRPTVLLLDEPLSALDLKLRKEMQNELKSLQRAIGVTFIYVTHDQEEAITLSDRIAVMNGGRIEQEGSPSEIYDRPVTRFVADFIGLTNFIPATVVEAREEPSGGAQVVVATALGVIHCGGRQPSVAPGDQVTLTLRPEKIQALQAGAEAPSEWNAVSGTVAQATFLGPQTEYIMATAAGDGEPGARLTVRQQNTASMAVTAAQGRGGDEYASAFRTGERLTLTWRREASLILRDAPPDSTAPRSVESIARSPQSSRA